MKKDKKEKLNLNIIDLVNTTYKIGEKELLHVASPSDINIDFIALYSRKNEYNKTKNTCICFYEDDYKFDNKNGIWDAIFHKDKNLLKKINERIKDVDILIAPDYSLFSEFSEAFNIVNIQRSRIVLLWLVEVCNKIVIPNVTFIDEDSLKYFYNGLEDCQVVAISTKGSLKNKETKLLFKEAIKILTIKLRNLKKIIVYDVSIKVNKTLELFNAATEKGIEIIIPNNTLKERNFKLMELKNGKK